MHFTGELTEAGTLVEPLPTYAAVQAVTTTYTTAILLF